MNELLNDRETYQILDQDPTATLMRKNNKIIMELYENHIIEEKDKNNMITDTALSPKIYGLIKTHKPNHPVRPVVSNVNSPCYSFAQYLAQLLKNITKESKYNTKNSMDFKRKIDDIELEEDRQIVSFDVKSLFTNIPIDFACSVIQSKWTDIQEFTRMSAEQLIKYVKFCVDDNNYFQFEGIIYKQNFGLAMGNPMSPILSDIVMDALFDSCLQNLTYTPGFLCKYVDDVITDVPKHQIDNTLLVFNNFHPRIQFTIEKEDENSSVPFLDMKVIRSGKNVVTDWYRKPTATTRLLHFHSCHPYSMKKNVAFNLMKRALEVSDPQFHEKNIKIASDILTQNNYPQRLIERTYHTVNSLRNRIETPPEPETSQQINETTANNAKYIYCSLKYVPYLTDSIKKQLSKMDMNIALQPINKLEDLYTKTKDKVENEDKSNVIYRIDCKEPCNKCYIGQTSKKLSHRIYQHNNDYNNMLIENSHQPNKLKTMKKKRQKINYKSLKFKKRTNVPKKTGCTALVSHGTKMFENGCNEHFDFKNVKILKSNVSNKKKREFLEAVEILKHDNNVNIKTDIRHVSQIYFPTLNKFFKKQKPN